MQRRNVPLVTTHSEDSNRSGSSTLPLISKSHRAQGGGVGRPKDNNSTARVIILLAIAVLITLATYMFPDQVEQEAEYVVHEAQAAEQEFLHWWDHRQQPPIPFEEHPHFQGLNDKISQIKHEDGKWVAGEKKLKAKLKVLAEKQAKGELLGVPVLTRWLGDDIPAWPDDTMDEATWKKKVEEKYEEMRQEEKIWKETVAKFMQEHNKHG